MRISTSSSDSRGSTQCDGVPESNGRPDHLDAAVDGGGSVDSH